MAPRIIDRGIASSAEMEALDLKTLADRLIRERREAGATFIGETIYGAIAFRPSN